MPHRVTKDFKKVFQAFSEGKEAIGGKVTMGGSGHRCRAEGNSFYSYNMLVAKRFTDNSGKIMYVVIDRMYAPSNTTRRHVDALMTVLPQAHIVDEGSILTWDFKFNSSY